MYVSSRLDYALRTLATLAASTDAGPLTATRLAEEQGASLAYVSAILNELRREGLLVNERGRNRGYSLARPAAEISIADVVSALRIWPVHGHTSDDPADHVSGRLAALWRRLDGATVSVLASVTVADLAFGSSPVPTSWRGRPRSQTARRPRTRQPELARTGILFASRHAHVRVPNM